MNSNNVQYHRLLSRFLTKIIRRMKYIIAVLIGHIIVDIIHCTNPLYRRHRDNIMLFHGYGLARVVDGEFVVYVQ